MRTLSPSSARFHRKVRALWLGVEDACESNRVDLHPTSVGSVQANFQSIPLDRAAFENIPSIILQPKSAWNILIGGVGSRRRSYGRAKLMSRGCATRVVQVKVLPRGFFSRWTVWPWCWALQRVVTRPQPHLSRNPYHLARHFHHPRLQMDCIRR